jgi:hypothetical protein
MGRVRPGVERVTPLSLPKVGVRRLFRIITDLAATPIGVLAVAHADFENDSLNGSGALQRLPYLPAP